MNEFGDLVADLNDLKEVPTDRLRERLLWDGLCMWVEPEWSGDDRADRVTAARYCVECPVARECTEFEFRVAGLATVGVWGPLSEDERRVAYLAWQARQDGGQR